MTLIQQVYSGKILRVLHEHPHALVLRPIPDDSGPDIIISREHYNMKWQPYSGPVPDAPQAGSGLFFGMREDEPVPERAGLQVEKRKRGRPRKHPVPA